MDVDSLNIRKHSEGVYFADETFDIMVAKVLMNGLMLSAYHSLNVVRFALLAKDLSDEAANNGIALISYPDFFKIDRVAFLSEVKKKLKLDGRNTSLIVCRDVVTGLFAS